MLTKLALFFPLAPVLFNRSLCWSSSPSACQFHSALLSVLPKAVPDTSQGKVACCGFMVVWSRLDSLFSSSPREDLCFSSGLSGCCETFMVRWVGTVLRVTTASPHTKWRGCSGEAVCFLAADGVLAAWVLRLCLVCDGITLSRAGGGIFLQKLSHNC